MFFPQEKVCLITGANSGIGKAAASGLAKLGLTLLLVSRNHIRGERTLKELMAESGNDRIHLFIADLSSQEMICNLAKDIKSKVDKIDILINNAGAYFTRRHLTVDGIEATFAVNYLSRFLLTNLLLDLLMNSPRGRIINVAGEYHRKGKIHFDDLTLKNSYSPIKAVAQSKLADVMLTYCLAEKLKNTKVTANCLHPGTISTNLIYSDPDSNILSRIFYKAISPFFSSADQGAETIIYLATSAETAHIRGNYFINKKAVCSSGLSHDKQIAAKLWEESEKLTSKYLIKQLTDNGQR